MSPAEVFLFIVFGVVAAIACVLGGYAGAVNTRRAFIAALRFLGLINVVVFIIASVVGAVVFPVNQGARLPTGLASILFWFVCTVPIMLVSAAFGWALTWLACYLHGLCRSRR